MVVVYVVVVLAIVALVGLTASARILKQYERGLRPAPAPAAPATNGDVVRS